MVSMMVPVMMPYLRHERATIAQLGVVVNPVVAVCYSSGEGWCITEIMETLLNVLVFVGILGAAAVFTEWFTRKMYYRCGNCATLNAKRRSQCRQCGEPLP